MIVVCGALEPTFFQVRVFCTLRPAAIVVLAPAPAVAQGRFTVTVGSGVYGSPYGQAYRSPYGYNRYDRHEQEHEDLDDEHADAHDDLDELHAEAHEQDLSRREHRRLHRYLEGQHAREHYELEREHVREHRGDRDYYWGY